MFAPPRTLLKARKLVPHGDWEDWVAQNVKGIQYRTAQNYMRLAGEINMREDTIRAQNKNGKTQLVSLLDEVQNLREAYRVIGIIKNGFRKTDFREKAPSPLKVKKDHPKLYEETLAEAKEDMLEVVQEIFKDHKEANWDVSQWTVDENEKPPFRDKGTARCLDALVKFIAGRVYNTELTHQDETGHKAGVVFREVFKAIIRANRPATSETQKPDEFIFELGNEPKPTVEVAQKLAA